MLLFSVKDQFNCLWQPHLPLSAQTPGTPARPADSGSWGSQSPPAPWASLVYHGLPTQRDGLSPAPPKFAPTFNSQCRGGIVAGVWAGMRQSQTQAWLPQGLSCSPAAGKQSVPGGLRTKQALRSAHSSSWSRAVTGATARLTRFVFLREFPAPVGTRADKPGCSGRRAHWEAPECGAGRSHVRPPPPPGTPQKGACPASPESFCACGSVPASTG